MSYNPKHVRRLIRAAERLYANLADAGQTYDEDQHECEYYDVKELRLAYTLLKKSGDAT